MIQSYEMRCGAPLLTEMLGSADSTVFLIVFARYTPSEMRYETYRTSSTGPLAGLRHGRLSLIRNLASQHGEWHIIAYCYLSPAVICEQAVQSLCSATKKHSAAQHHNVLSFQCDTTAFIYGWNCGGHVSLSSATPARVPERLEIAGMEGKGTAVLLGKSVCGVAAIHVSQSVSHLRLFFPNVETASALLR